MKKLLITLAGSLAVFGFIVQMTATVEAQISPSSSCYTFTRNLGQGWPMNTAEATALAKDLTNDGLWSASSTITVYNDAVASAVSKFQQKYSAQILTPNGLTVGTGFVGASTRMELNKLHGCLAAASSATSSSHPIYSSQCPVGYACTPITQSSTKCPIGYVCTPINSSTATVNTSSSDSTAAGSTASGSTVNQTAATSGGTVGYIPGFGSSSGTGALTGAVTPNVNSTTGTFTGTASANANNTTSTSTIPAGAAANAAPSAITSSLMSWYKNVPLASINETCGANSGYTGQKPTGIHYNANFPLKNDGTAPDLECLSTIPPAMVNSEGSDPYWTNKSDPNGYVGEASTNANYQNPWLSASNPLGIVYSNGTLSQYSIASNLCKNPISLSDAKTLQSRLRSIASSSQDILTSSNLYVYGSNNMLYQFELATEYLDGNNTIYSYDGTTPPYRWDVLHWYDPSFQSAVQNRVNYVNANAYSLTPVPTLGLARCLDAGYKSNFPQWSSFFQGSKGNWSILKSMGFVE